MPFQSFDPPPVSALDHKRRLRAVESLQVLGATPHRILDDLSEVMARVIRSDVGFIALSLPRRVTLIGAYNLPAATYACAHRDGNWPPSGIIEHHDLPSQGWAATHALVNGETDRLDAIIMAALRHDGQTVGMIGTGSRSPVGAYTEIERALLLKLREVAEAALRAEVVLGRLASEAFRALERSRDFLGGVAR